MCGIVGFTGEHQAAPILLDGLSKLEYRGYDSAGIAVRDGSADAEIIKAKGCDDMPKMLALYKQVEDYNNGGDGVEGLKDWAALDDTILLLSDDNFGNVRTLPTKENRDRKAGFGLYYHFDYHG